MELEQLSYNAIVGAINNHAKVRTYDEWILLVAILTFLASTTLALFSYLLNRKQSNTLENQNKIAMFEKRYELYSRIDQLALNINILQKMYNEYENTSLEKNITYLFYKVDGAEKFRKFAEKCTFIASQFYKVELLFKINKELHMYVDKMMQIILAIQIDCMRVDLNQGSTEAKKSLIITNYIDSTFQPTELQELSLLSFTRKCELLQELFTQSKILDKLRTQVVINF